MSNPPAPPAPSTPSDPQPGDPGGFPRRHARTQHFSLGTPRVFRVAPDGSRALFLRSRSGTDRAQLLWVLDLDGGGTAERLVVEPLELLGTAGERLTPEERARRERSRERAAGIVGYAVDAAVRTAAFTLSGRLFTADLTGTGDGAVREVPVPGPVADPQLSPDGRHVAWVRDGALHAVALDEAAARPLTLAEPEDDDVAYGLAEFVAAEEMSRFHGFWWSPESDRLLVARVDDSPVRRWWIADPAHPAQPPAQIAYPAAGTPNADVRLFVLGLDGSRTEVVWDRAAYPYLARVHWSQAGPPLLLVQARDQRSQLHLAVDPATGATRMVHADEDPRWLELSTGVPCWSPAGQLVRIADEGGARVLSVAGRPLTGPQLHVRAVLDVADDDVLVSASAGAAAGAPETGEIHVYRVNELGVERVTAEPGVHTAVRSGGVTVLTSAVPGEPGTTVRVLRNGTVHATVASLCEDPQLTPRVTLTEAVVPDDGAEPGGDEQPPSGSNPSGRGAHAHAGARRIPCAVLLPSWYRAGDGPLPVLMDPYGGPHGQMVLAAQHPYLVSQWFAEQGFAVVVADGRGTPGHSPGWEKSIRDEVAAIALQDQVDAVHALAGRFPLDLGRVAIRGWSFGGYLAALAALRRPDVFHAAVVGAPVTDLRLYDTHYEERYLGLPDEQPEVYRRNSLIDDHGLVGAVEPHRPMMIIHGLADDNVVVAHSLRLSSALLAAGRAHEVLPLSGVTHMAAQEEVAENLLLFQRDFLRRSLGLTGPGERAAGR